MISLGRNVKKSIVKILFMKSYLLFVVLFFSCALLRSQNLIKNAEQALAEQAYQEVITPIDLVVQNRKEYSDKDLAKAHYLRGFAYFQITTQADLLKQQPTAFSKCYHDLKMVSQFDHKGIWTDQVKQHLNDLRPVVTNNSIKLIQSLYTQNLAPQQKTETASLAQGFLEILIDMEPDNYVNYDLRGQVKLAVMDSLTAMMDFQNSIKLYKNKPPLVADFFIAYTYYRTALIQREALAAESQARSTLQAGLRFLESERRRMEPLSIQQQQQYQKALIDLQNFELDLYYQDPGLTKQALQKFETALINDPNNYTNRCAYASLLEANYPEKAVAQYLEAINVGVLYLNQSIRFIKQSTPQVDLINREIEANQIAKKALPYLEEAYKIDPKDKSLLQTIIDISMKVNDLVKYQYYKNIRSQDKMR